VAKANIACGEVPLVIGCGPVGLAVIAALKIRGLHPIVAADYSPTRRALAEQLGADIVVDPARTQPYATWAEHARCRRKRRRRIRRCRHAAGAQACADLRMRRRAGPVATGVRGCAARCKDRRGRRLHGERPLEPMLGI
jgi:threonine dehydrogenase-like Zn-dependent dehydrogenase